jgi:hypothetical protein
MKWIGLDWIGLDGDETRRDETRRDETRRDATRRSTVTFIYFMPRTKNKEMNILERGVSFCS